MGYTHLRRSGIVLPALVLIMTACGGGDAENAAGPAGPGGEDSLATVVRIDSAVDARIDTATDFTEVGEAVGVNAGDEVRTDATGFAEITYFDSSLTRLDVDTTFTVTELADEPDTSVIRTDMGPGRTWHRVTELTGDDTYRVDTSVATATVRGTAFLITCEEAPDTCTFDVFEGTVEITPAAGDPVTLEEGQSLTVTADEPPAAPVEVAPALLDDGWIERNTELDTDAGHDDLEIALDADSGADDDNDADRTTLVEGDYVLTVSDPRLLEATGSYEGASVTVEDGTIVVQRGTTEARSPVAGTVDVSCSSSDCHWFHHGQPVYVELDDGPPFRLLSPMTGEPHQATVCGYAPPPNAFVIDDITEESFTYLSVWGGGHGGGDGCGSSFSVAYTATMTRAFEGPTS